MRIGVVVIVAACLLAACVHLKTNQNINALKQVKPGDSLESVVRIMGPPDIRRDITDQRLIVYYQTKVGQSADASITPDLCTPIAIENDRVVSIGDDLADQWTREEQARIRNAQNAERERIQAEMSAKARRQAENARQRKIAALEKEVRPVPVHNAELNLKLYRQLLELDPDNVRYQKKVAFYEARLAEQVKSRQARAARTAKRKELEAWEKTRESRNKHLRQYSGNGIAEMAVHDMGPGSLYVWVKNVSMQIITTHPDHFTLLDKDNHEIRCKISSSLDSVLEPGGISHGKIEFDPDIIPRELIFRNRESGRIVKTFK